MNPTLSKWLTGLFAGAVGGIIMVFFEISFANLIFIGELAPYLGQGIGFTLFGLMAMSLLTIFINKFKGIIMVPQDTPSVILALMGAALASTIAVTLKGDALFATVVAGIIIATVLTGLCFWLLGHFKLGSLSRFIPYPVIAGFLAGTGWLLTLGSFGLLTNESFSWSSLASLFEYTALMQWMPGVMFALVLLALMRQTDSRWILPGALATSLILFFLFLFLSGTSLDEARAYGWMMGPLPSGELWQPFTLDQLALVNWPLLATQAGAFATVVLISFVSMMLNISGIELTSNRDIDLNQQLKSVGLTNMLSGLGGTPPGYPTITFTRLGWLLAPPSHALNVGYVAVAGLVLLAGVSALSFMPKFIVGGLLLFVGIGYLIEWLVDTWHRMPKSDYVVIVVILLVIATFGVLEGIGVGIVVAASIFLINYSRTEVIQQTLFGTEARSNVDRPAPHVQHLEQHGKQLAILKLQGYIFFGTGNNLFRHARTLSQNIEAPLRFVILDFNRVTGLDSSTEFSFQRMIRLAESAGFTLCFAHVSEYLLSQLERTVLKDANTDLVQVFSDLDHALEWCEDNMLEISGALNTDAVFAFEDFLKHTVQDDANVPKLMAYFDKLEHPQGTTLIHQGHDAVDLYFMESGAAEVKLLLSDNNSLRLRKVRPGTLIGEVGMFLHAQRSASVILSQPSVLYCLTSDDLKRMEVEDPILASAFYHLILDSLASRLADNSRIIRSLSV